MDAMLAREFEIFRDEMRTELHGELGNVGLVFTVAAITFEAARLV